MQQVVRLAPELLLVLLGVAVRLPGLWCGEPACHYDPVDHARYVEWFAERFDLPPLDYTRSTYGPPLYYLLAGLLLRGGASVTGVALLSLGLATARLALLAWGLARWVPSRPARLAALALAAVLPAAVHIDGMINNESLNMLLCLGLLLAAAGAFAAEGRARWWRALGAGALGGLALLTKFSAVTMLAGLAVAVACEAWWRSEDGWRGRARRLAPWLAAGALALALAAPWYVRTASRYGTAFPTAFHTHDGGAIPEPLRHVPVPDRRTLGYFFAWTNDVFRTPFYPAGVSPQPRFWPQLLAVTFSDYYGYLFAPPPRAPEERSSVHPRVTRAAATAARVSVAGGALVAALTAAGLLALLSWAWRERSAAVLGLALAPVLAVIGQAYFATKYPADTYGVVKASYLQFAAGPLFAAFGLAVAWAGRRRLTWPLAASALAALAAVAAYTMLARLSW